MMVCGPRGCERLCTFLCLLNWDTFASQYWGEARRDEAAAGASPHELPRPHSPSHPGPVVQPPDLRVPR